MRRHVLLTLILLFFAAPAQADDALTSAIDLYNKDRYFEAFQILAKAPGKPRVLYYKALCQLRLGDNDAANDTFRSLIISAPGSPEASMAQRYFQAIEASFAAETSQGLPKHARIPYRIARDNSLHVQATVNGHQLDMIWDTGATNCSVPDYIVDNVANGIKTSVETPKGPQLAIKAPVEIEIAGFKRKAVTTVMSGEAVIGQSFFKDYTVEFNKELHYIYLDLASTAGGGRAQTKVARNALTKFQVPFEREAGIMVVDVTVQGRPLKAYFDTGCAASGIAMSVQLARSLFIRNGDTVAVQIGPIDRQNVGVTFAQGMSRPLIGPAVFGDRKYKIDPVNQVIDFDYVRE